MGPLPLAPLPPLNARVLCADRSPVLCIHQVVHQGVSKRSKDYYDMLRRYNYVTPTSYLELLQTFKVQWWGLGRLM